MEQETFRLALEIGGDNWCMAWVIDLPGCFINRPSAQEAMDDTPEEIRDYLRWLQQHGEDMEGPERITVEVAETVTSRGTAERGMTRAFLSSDQERMTHQQLATLFRRLHYSRQDLLELLNTVPQSAWIWQPDKREKLISTYYPTIKDQVQHIALAERWYIQKLWPVPRFSPAKTPVERLEKVRQFVVNTLSEHAVLDSSKMVEVDGQNWTVRKVLRRLLYHEPYHFHQIQAILNQYTAYAH
ncbi:MAG: DinB family protein [Anaerolineae bacterium]